MRFKVLACLTIVISACGSAAPDGATSSQPEPTPDTEKVVEEVAGSAPAATDSAAPRPTSSAAQDVDADSEVVTIETPECDEDAACAEAYLLADQLFLRDCTAVRETAVDDQQIVGQGLVGEQSVTANAIGGTDPTMFLAISLPGGGACYGEDETEPTTKWSLLVSESATSEAVRDAVCGVGDSSPARRATLDCPS